jgi:DNA polymerase (family 10)
MADYPHENRTTSEGEPISNADIADQLTTLAQLLSVQNENRYKVKAWNRAAAKIRTLTESLAELVHEDADLTVYKGIGDAVAAVREIVLKGNLHHLEMLRASVHDELAAISRYPRLDPRRVLRTYKKLGISSIAELREKLESGEIRQVLGDRMEQHIRQGLTEAHAMLLYRADDLRTGIEEFLLDRCRVRRAEPAGDYRRRRETVEEIAFVIETGDFPSVVAKLQHMGGRTPLISCEEKEALFALSSGIMLRIRAAAPSAWGLNLIECTGSKSHLDKLTSRTGSLARLEACTLPDESVFYRRFGLSFIEPELREGHDEVERAGDGSLPVLVSAQDIRGDLHAHSLSSDGRNSIEEMAEAAQQRGYEYVGITDHSQSLKIARGLPAEDLWQQIRFIDRLNERLNGIRILKSSEVDILADGSLDYPDELLKELDYTVCSIHSRFALGKREQTERIMRAMDNRRFHILGHATGRLLLKRTGYEIDVDRIIPHARQAGCFFEINSSPDRLDLSAENARAAAQAGVRIAISTDSHSTREFALIRYGLDQARRAGLTKSSVLNCLTWRELQPLLQR